MICKSKMALKSTQVIVEIRIHYQEIKKIFLKYIAFLVLIKEANVIFINPKL